nr:MULTISPECIES: helix-turn-helix transcriptional regulator [unclassified Lysinibacillus]
MRSMIKMLRNKFGITKAILTKECGVVRQTINCIENDKYEPLALNMAKVLNSRIDEVFMYD